MKKFICILGIISCLALTSCNNGIKEITGNNNSGVLINQDITTINSNAIAGSDVVCIGNHLGSLPSCVSFGIVSCLNRLINVDAIQNTVIV